jgi:WD40 repeat protein
MKLKTISRSYEEASRDSKSEIRKVHKNADPKLHPFEKAREYTRAVTAAKMDRMFAAPFIGAMSDHSDGVYCSATNPKSLVSFVSGSADGEVIVWDLASRTKLWSVVAHTGFVRGLTVSHDGDYFYSCGDDKRIRQWRLASNDAVAAALTDGSVIAGVKRAGSGRVGGGGREGGAKRGRYDEDDDDEEQDDDEDEIDYEEGDDEDIEEEDDDEYAALVAGARSSSGAGSSSSSSAGAGGARGGRSYAADEDLDTRKRFGQASSGTLGRLAAGASVSPVATWSSPTNSSFLSIDHHWRESLFVTCGPGGLDVWDAGRAGSSSSSSAASSAPKQSYSWGSDSVTTCKWNPAESGLIASTGADRSVVLYDIRTDSALRKVVFAMSNNSLAWNPREPMTFTTANEDSNCYTFDMRRLDKALMVHKDHTMAVMDLSYSPTGKEFVTGSYDKTIRIFKVDSGKSRELYHTKRMQRVFTVKFTGDGKFILSGSDDTNIRIWKAQASASLGRTMPRERAKLDYSQALIKRFRHMPEVKTILSSRNVPKPIKKAREAKFNEEQKERRKLANIRAHTAPDSKAGIPEAARKKAIVGELK